MAFGSAELSREAVTVTAVAAAASPTLVGFSDTLSAVGAASSSVIVPVAEAVPTVACRALLSVTVNVSFPSASRSSAIGTEIWRCVVPTGNVSVPDVAV